MKVGIDKNQRVEFSLSSDTTEPKTVFVFRPLTGTEMIDISGNITGRFATLQGERIIKFLDLAIVEIRNYPEGLSKKDYLESLSANDILELVGFGSQLCGLTKDEEKNS